MRGIVVGTLGTALLLTLTLSAQSRPDLSGTWLLDESKDAARQSSGGGAATSGGAGGGGGGVRVGSGGGAVGGSSGSAVSGMRAGGGGRIRQMHLAQTATSLTIERIAGPTTFTSVYTFDGQENVNVIGRTTSKTRSRWDGARLVTEGTQTTSRESGDITIAVKEVRSLAADGTLIVESERGTEGGNVASRQVYRKQ